MGKPQLQPDHKGKGAGAAQGAGKATGAATGAAQGGTVQDGSKVRAPLGTDAGKDAGAAQGAQGDTPAETRKRNALSPQKVFAIAIAGLAAILGRPEIDALLTEPEKAQVKSASDLAADLNAKTIKPIQDRIKEIQAAFVELAPKIAEPGSGEKAKELSIELGRLQKRLVALTSAAAPAE